MQLHLNGMELLDLNLFDETLDGELFTVNWKVGEYYTYTQVDKDSRPKHSRLLTAYITLSKTYWED